MQKMEASQAEQNELSAEMMTGDSILNQKIKEYSRNRKIISVLLWAFLVLGVSYLLFIILQDETIKYQELSAQGFVMEPRIAASSDGEVIAIAASKDSVTRLFLSRDAGDHFLKLGSWHMREQLRQVFVAPDKKIILAATGRELYYFKAGMDSLQKFTPAIPLPGSFIKNFFFDSLASSVFVYGSFPSVFEIKLSDMSLTSHQLNGDYNIVSLARSENEWKAIAVNKNSLDYVLLEGAQLEKMSESYLRSTFSFYDMPGYSMPQQNIDSTTSGNDTRTKKSKY